MSALFQEMSKLLQINRINATAFNPKMQDKIEISCGTEPDYESLRKQMW
jgi:hypothetical protein